MVAEHLLLLVIDDHLLGNAISLAFILAVMIRAPLVDLVHVVLLLRDSLVLLPDLLVSLLLDRAGHAFAIVRLEIGGLRLLFFLDCAEFVDPGGVGARPAVLLDDLHNVHLRLTLLNLNCINSVGGVRLVPHLLQLMVEAVEGDRLLSASAR